MEDGGGKQVETLKILFAIKNFGEAATNKLFGEPEEKENKNSQRADYHY